MTVFVPRGRNVVAVLAALPLLKEFALNATPLVRKFTLPVAFAGRTAVNVTPALNPDGFAEDKTKTVGPPLPVVND